MALDYYILREFADTWGLLFLFLAFVFIAFLTFRPSAKDKYKQGG